MKIPISDAFLWDLYNFLDKTGDVLKFMTRRPTMYNYLSGPKNPIFRKYQKDIGAKRFSKLVYYLKVNSYIEVSGLKGKEAILISKKGISKALKASFIINGKKKRSDGKWIMLTFDIPQKHKKARMLLRSILANLGYKMFQQSIWVCPYNVSNETEKLLQMHNLDRYVKIFLIEKL
jgi:hypothetical protein